VARLGPLSRGHMLARTLGEMVHTKIVLLAVCRRCKHESIVYPFSLIPRFGEDFPAMELRQRLRCSSCRGRMANLYEASR